MNMHKVFIFNVCILMSFPNVSAMQMQEDDSSLEEDLYSEENLQELKQIKQNKIIKLKKNVIDVIETDIKSIKERIKIIEKQDKRIETFLLQHAEQNLMKPRVASPDIVGQGEKRQRCKAKLTKELEEKIKQKNNFQKELAKIKEEDLTKLNLKELKSLYKDLKEKLYNKYAEADESDFSENDIILSRFISTKEQRAEELTSFVKDEDELYAIKERKISEDELLPKEICGTTTLSSLSTDNSDQIIKSGDLSRKIKFTPNGRFFRVPSLPSFFNIITYVISGSPINKPNNVNNNNEVCISAINKAVSPIERFADSHLYTYNRNSLIKLLVTKHSNNSNNSNNFDHMIIGKASQEQNMQLGKGIIEILSYDKIFNKIKENHNHIPHAYHQYLQARNKNPKINNIAILLTNKDIFSKAKDKQISTIGFEYLQSNKDFLDTWFEQVQEMSNTLVYKQIEPQKSQELTNKPFQYTKSNFDHEHKQKILNTFVEGQITALETQAWINKAVNDVFKIFTK